jgi:hypothetical protein
MKKRKAKKTKSHNNQRKSESKTDILQKGVRIDAEGEKLNISLKGGEDIKRGFGPQM